MTSRF